MVSCIGFFESWVSWIPWFLKFSWFFKFPLFSGVLANISFIIYRNLHLSYPKGDVIVSNDVQFTMNSDLIEESPQFTLTCISTGGPATTVMWTRDSKEVIGGMTVLNDTVSAQYTHTLTVTGRLGGLYQLTVFNNKPSQGSASLRVKGRLLLVAA